MSNRRGPERQSENLDSNFQTFTNEEIKEIGTGPVLLKRGLKISGDMQSLPPLKDALAPYARQLEGKYTTDLPVPFIKPTGSVTLTEDVNLNILNPIDFSKVSILGSAIKRSDESKEASLAIDPNDPEVQALSKERLEAVEGVVSQARESREDMEGLMTSITEIFGSDKNFLQKISALLTLILSKLTGNQTLESTTEEKATTNQEPLRSQESVEQATDEVRSQFDLKSHQSQSVFDLRLNPFKEGKADDLSSYLTYRAQDESLRKRLIIRPEGSTLNIPDGFETQSMENFESNLQAADENAFKESLNTPLAIESKNTNPGFVSLVSVMQSFLNTPEANNAKRNEIASNIRRDYVSQSNPNSAIASRFLETFPTSG